MKFDILTLRYTYIYIFYCCHMDIIRKGCILHLHYKLCSQYKDVFFYSMGA